MAETASSILTAAWTEITNGVTMLMGNEYTKLMIILPVASTVIGISKGIFPRQASLKMPGTLPQRGQGQSPRPSLSF